MERAVFFDLQGTLGGDYMGDIQDFAFYPFAAEAIATARRAGYRALIVTNQSHIARGMLTLEEFWRRAEALGQELAAQGALWDGVYCCPHRKGDVCGCKKPLPGMVLQAAAEWDLDLSASWVVGDSGSADVGLARRVGAGAVLVLTGGGLGSVGEHRFRWQEYEADHIAADALAAVRWIVAWGSNGAGEES